MGRKSLQITMYLNSGLYWKNCVSAEGVYSTGVIRLWGGFQGIILDVKTFYEHFKNFM